MRTESEMLDLILGVAGKDERILAVLDTACALFRTMAQTVSGHFGYTYNEEEDRFITAYLHRIATP